MWFLFIVLFLVVIPSVTDVGDYRNAIAEEIGYGKLESNECLEKHLKIGDEMLGKSDRNHRETKSTYSGTESWEGMLFLAFNAKVHYERARLCSEVLSKK